MSFSSVCPGCMAGNHDDHDAQFGVKPGLIGGERCDCIGDCGTTTSDFDGMFS